MEYLNSYLNQIILGNNVDILINFPGNCIDLTITSPPYDSIRNYNKKLQGLQEQYNGYSFPFESLAQQLYRVTKDGGVVVWVVGDETVDGSESGSSFRQSLYFKEIGFKLYDTMIYEKASVAFPSDCRYYQSFEYMFVMSKGKPKTINLIKDKENKNVGEKAHWGKNIVRTKNDRWYQERKKIDPVGQFSVRTNIWRMKNSKGFSTEDEEAHKIHPAIFPEELVKDHIISWSQEGDIILDPYSGSGTTAKVAKKYRRRFIGIDINEKYIEYSKKRLENYGTNNLMEICS
jgi:site-specific DNA-methyltransferase (adenine-specific)